VRLDEEDGYEIYAVNENIPIERSGEPEELVPLWLPTKILE
jgi:hypothetical protein